MAQGIKGKPHVSLVLYGVSGTEAEKVQVDSLELRVRVAGENKIIVIPWTTLAEEGTRLLSIGIIYRGGRFASTSENSEESDGNSFNPGG
jgi:hypothetical protein